MNKFYLLIALLLPITSYAKSYEVTLSPCDIGSNCKKCHEVIKLSYIVNMNTKQVFVAGKDTTGKDIKEPIDKCQITDVNNWTCDSAQLVTNTKNGVITVINKPESSLARSKKEICVK